MKEREISKKTKTLETVHTHTHTHTVRLEACLSWDKIRNRKRIFL